MPNCSFLTGDITRTCDNNVGGIKQIFIQLKSNVDSLTLSSPGGKIETITMVGGATFYEIELTKNTSFYTENGNADEANGTELYTQTVTIVLNRREKTKRDQLLLLGKFNELVIIAKDSNDLLWYFGEENGLMLTTNEGGSGTTKADPNRYTLTFVGQEPALANEVLQAALDAVD